MKVCVSPRQATLQEFEEFVLPEFVLPSHSHAPPASAPRTSSALLWAWRGNTPPGFGKSSGEEVVRGARTSRGVKEKRRMEFEEGFMEEKGFGKEFENRSRVKTSTKNQVLEQIQPSSLQPKSPSAMPGFSDAHDLLLSILDKMIEEESAKKKRRERFWRAMKWKRYWERRNSKEKVRKGSKE